ncbi:MAG TPA: YCF48-related protein, partial [Pyrinomonadaceae bacterium]|nr:YCF48-related protein [Pyrinomonadaceae bacterium]
WTLVRLNAKEWLYDVAFADAQRGYAVGGDGLILRTDDGGLTWKDQESGVGGNLFGVGAADRDDVLVAGDQGRVLRTKDGGLTWELQPTITSAALFGVAYLGGSDAWVAGRGGAILRRASDVATVKIPRTKTTTPALKIKPKLQEPPPLVVDDGDIPLAVPPKKQ